MPSFKGVIMEKRHYENPPITEAVCEFRIPHDMPWDSKLTAEIATAFTKDFPNREIRHIQEVQIQNPKDSKFPQMQFSTGEIQALFNHDRSKLIQIGSHMLAINKLKPYPGWKNFSSDIENLLKIIETIIKPKYFQRIGLRYINQLELSQEFSNDYLQPMIKLGSDLDKKVDKFETGFSLIINDTDHCKLQFNKLFSKTTNSHIYYIDIDYFLNKPHAVALENANNWLISAHEQIYDIFEKCIMPKAREKFKEKHNARA